MGLVAVAREAVGVFFSMMERVLLEPLGDTENGVGRAAAAGVGEALADGVWEPCQIHLFAPTETAGNAGQHFVVALWTAELDQWFAECFSK